MHFKPRDLSAFGAHSSLTGSASRALSHPCLGEGSPTIDYRKKRVGTLIPTSLLEDLA